MVYKHVKIYKFVIYVGHYFNFHGQAETDRQTDRQAGRQTQRNRDSDISILIISQISLILIVFV